MALMIALLGSPRVERDGEEQPGPRGRKAWALLAYLLLATRPVARAELAGLLFPEADDPLAALRWNLTELRRLLRGSEALRADPLQLSLGAEDRVDIRLVTAGSWEQAEELPDLGRDLLEHMSFPSCPSFEVWLESERRHVRGATEAMLREGALTCLAGGDAGRAADLAGLLVRLNPLDENFQALLIRSLAAAGQGVAAARQVAACRELFRRELGVEPSPAVAAAAATVTATPTRQSASGPSAVTALIEAGTAAVRAGALEAGLDCLRRAVTEAEALGDSVLEARALTALGTALVHAARGRDEEGATALHQALSVSTADTPAIEAEASRELGYVEYLAGRYDRVETWLARAERAAGSDPAERARILSVRGSALSDVADYEGALDALHRSCDEAGDDRVAAYSWSMIGRVHLLRGDLEPATRALDTSLALTERSGHTAFRPWPQSLRGTVHLESGEPARARRLLEDAFAMSCHLGDPCWEGISGRGLGLIQTGQGEVGAAVDTLLDARARSRRHPDGYHWLDAYTLDALCGIAVENDLDQADGWIDELSTMAAHSGMHELLVRSMIHRARRGDDDALSTARSRAASIANPALGSLLGNA